MYSPELFPIITIMTGKDNPNPLPEPPPGRKLERIWTVINQAEVERIGPHHNITAFLEDKGHDWVIHKGSLRFFSRVVEMNQPVEIVLDYTTSQEFEQRRRDFVRENDARQEQIRRCSMKPG